MLECSPVKNSCRAEIRYGFKDKSDVVRTAVDRLFTELTQQRLRESAALYLEDEIMAKIDEALKIVFDLALT